MASLTLLDDEDSQDTCPDVFVPSRICLSLRTLTWFHNFSVSSCLKLQLVGVMKPITGHQTLALIGRTGLRGSSRPVASLKRARGHR